MCRIAGDPHRLDMIGVSISSENEGESPGISLMRLIIEQNSFKEAVITSYYDEAGGTVI